MKGYEIFEGIVNKEIKDGTQFRMLKDDNIYTYRNNNLVCRYGELNVIKILNQEFEIIEDKEDTNIQDIKELTYKGLLDLYNKEKQKNKEYENKIKSVLELIDTKPYTAYTLYGDILYDDKNIREILEERN